MSKNEEVPDVDLKKLVERRSKEIIERFGKIAVSHVTDPHLREILEYVRTYWKDKLRPALTSLSCEAVGGKSEMAEDASLMFTLAAAGTQIHDEIIDKSLKGHFRRTVFGNRGTDEALLAGDLLIVKAWAMLREIAERASEPSLIVDVVEAYNLISIEICEAELFETSCRRKTTTDLKIYEGKFLWKINADLEACTRAGAILGGGSESEIRALADVGRRFGFLMGLNDDVTDCMNLEGNLPHRLEFESVPLPILYAANSSNENQPIIESILKKSPISSSDAAQLLGMCFDTGAFTYLSEIARQSAKEARSKLQTIKPSIARSTLELMIEKLVKEISQTCA